MPVSGIHAIWCRRGPLALALLPLSGLFCLIVRLRRCLYRAGWLRPIPVGVPVIIVGNLSVGGAGKTPLVIWLAGHLQALGLRPGIVSRGYGGRSPTWPCAVGPESDPALVGDEPVLIARRTGCPLWVGPDRVAAARALLASHDCDCLISDDGLQHYRLARDIEIAVVDGVRRLGNGWCLPAGPLREPPSRLAEVDLVVFNGGGRTGEHPMHLIGARLVNLADPQRTQPLAELSGAQVHALAGIGHPERFFRDLEGVGLRVKRHPLPDHHPITPRDLPPNDGLPVLMTEKDAVKCRGFAEGRLWYLPVEAMMGPGFEATLSRLIRATRPPRNA